MRINRVYQQQSICVGTHLELDDNASKHIGRVLRMQLNDPLVVFNGDGFDYSAVITAVSKKAVTVNIIEQKAINTESPLQIHLVQGIARGEKMDLIIQKAVELGVSEITPVFTDFSNVKLQGERQDKKQEHWQKVAISACEQCNRAKVPTVNAAINFKQWLKAPKDGLKLILHPYHSQSIKSLSPQQKIILLVGPEGGLSEDEIKSAQAQGFSSVLLGPRILRTETAPLAAISVFQVLWGDL